jgi:hypothetical protein
MKLVIKDRDMSQKVQVDLYQDDDDDVFVTFGGYSFIRIKTNGQILFETFFVNSPMHKYCVLHDFPMENVGTCSTQFRMERI